MKTIVSKCVATGLWRSHDQTKNLLNFFSYKKDIENAKKNKNEPTETSSTKPSLQKNRTMRSIGNLIQLHKLSD